MASPVRLAGHVIDGDFEGDNYVRGHVPFEDAHRAVCARDGNDPAEWTYTARHRWGRWGQDAATKEGMWDRSLYTYDEPGRGRFPVTELRYGKRAKVAHE